MTLAERQELTKVATIACRNTVGYSEAEDKEAYMSAVHTAIFVTMETVAPILNGLRDSLEHHQKFGEDKDNHLRTIAGILQPYMEG